MADTKLTEDEERLAAQHEAVKSRVERSVNSDIADQAAVAPQADAKIHDAAGHLRTKAVDETVRSEKVLDNSRVAARGSQFIDYLFYLLYSLLIIRLLLVLIAARPGNGFVNFIANITNPFYAPFRGIVPNLTTDVGMTVAIPILIAIVVYAMLHSAINGLLRMVGSRKTEI